MANETIFKWIVFGAVVASMMIFTFISGDYNGRYSVKCEICTKPIVCPEPIKCPPQVDCANRIITFTPTTIKEEVVRKCPQLKRFDCFQNSNNLNAEITGKYVICDDGFELYRLCNESQWRKK